MASLGSILSVSVQSLENASDALQITNNNIANANTPGYTREVPDFVENAPVSDGNLNIGTGADIADVTSVRDQLLQSQIQQQTQAQSSTNAQLSSLQTIQTAFTSSSTDIGTEMSALFSSLSSLTTDPSNSSLGEAVLTAGQNLATSFNTASNALVSQQDGLNSQVGEDVGEINQLASEIAALNPEIVTAQASSGQDAGTLQDQQDELVLKLSALTNVSVAQTNSGITLTTGSGTPLVIGTESYALKTKTGSDGSVQVTDQNGNDITSEISGGDLGGTIETRDTTIPALQNQLDTLASQLAKAFNTTQAAGYDQNGNAGQNFFTISSTVAGSAGSIAMNISDPSLIAVSTDPTSAGSDGNLANFADIQTNALPAGQTPTNAYAAIVYQVGSLTSNANAESTALTSSLTQLNDQLGSVSGVSTDEETANLLAYQQSYEAAARVVTTVQAMFTVIMSMGTASAD